MSEPCAFDFVPRKGTVRDSVAQIGNCSSKSEALIQSETTLNAGETENSSTGLLEASHQREHKDVRYFWIPEQVPDEDFSIQDEKNCANMGKMPWIWWQGCNPDIDEQKLDVSRSWMWRRGCKIGDTYIETETDCCQC